jgi:hypothetical protein
MNEGLQAFLHLLEALGLPRFTNDADLLVGILPADVDAVAASLGAGFCMDPDEATKSIRLGRALSVLHLRSAWRIDVFPVASVEFHHSEMDLATLRDWVSPGGRHHALENALVLDRRLGLRPTID